MVVPIEVTELFKLNKFTEDIKWLIYKKLWKHLYCIKSEMKNELLSKANLINSIYKFKNIFKPNEFLSYDEEIDGVVVKVINYTNYYDALIYNLYMFFHNENIDNIELCFNYICSVSNDHNEQDEPLLTINMALVLDVDNEDEKMKLLMNKWNTLTYEEQIRFNDSVDDRDFNETIIINP